MLKSIINKGCEQHTQLHFPQNVKTHYKKGNGTQKTGTGRLLALVSVWMVSLKICTI